ncbi:MAG TPA: hypothetical protein VN969_24610 [Streptosporangiaceae bacterium]|jgi:hypothetical protein|nr:hypothetical protein [Streptosporangiaceae bacterium]
MTDPVVFVPDNHLPRAASRWFPGFEDATSAMTAMLKLNDITEQ